MVSINPEKALKVPGVLAVITAETLKTVNLAWMPTLAGDVQMVLADGKVLFQNQEVAFVVATDRYAADDGINKVIVEYEPLTPLIDPFKAMDKDAPVLREDLAGHTAQRVLAVDAEEMELDPADTVEHAEMFRDGLSGHGQLSAEAGGRATAVRKEQIEHPPTGRIPDRGPQLVVDGGGHGVDTSRAR